MSEPAEEASREPAEQGLQVSRLFEQAPDAPSFYSDVAQVLGTGNEVVLQFYETIPNAPGASGRIEGVRSRLRATVILSPGHAGKMGQLLLEHAGQIAPPNTPGTTEGGESQ